MGCVSKLEAQHNPFYWFCLSRYRVKVKAKVVHDGNIITAAGVTSGLELGFYLIKLLFGSALAKEVANRIEYVVNIDTL